MPFLEAGGDASEYSGGPKPPLGNASKTIRPSKSTERSECERVFSAEEARAIKGHRDVVAPSREEHENHMRAHIPFRKL